MTETFQELKKKLTEFYCRTRGREELEAAFNQLDTDCEMRGIGESMKESFPKEPTLGDEYSMYFAYAVMRPEVRTDKDRNQWLQHTKKFINRCPPDPQLAGHLCSVIMRLPEMGGSSGETFNYGLRALKLLPKNFARHADCTKAVEKMARTDFRSLLEKACSQPDYQKQLRAFDRALARLSDIPSGERYRGLDECIRAMVPVYHQTEWGRQELPRKRRLASNRIFKSLPHNVQQIIRNRKNQNDWLSK